jgi:hypothetical protein
LKLFFELHCLAVVVKYFFRKVVNPLIKESSLSLLLVNDPVSWLIYALVIEVLNEVR